MFHPPPIEAHRIGDVRITKDFYTERFTFKGWRRETVQVNDPRSGARMYYLNRTEDGGYWTHGIQYHDEIPR